MIDALLFLAGLGLLLLAARLLGLGRQADPHLDVDPILAQYESCGPSPSGTHCAHWWDCDGPCCFCLHDPKIEVKPLEDELQ